MKVYKVFCLIVICILLLSANILAVVYDDEGNIITEGEIKKEMDEMHRTGMHPGRGCVIGGCISGLIPLSIGIFVGKEVGGEWWESLMYYGPTLGVAGAAAAFLGVKVGNHIDRKAATGRIKAKRHSQRQGFLDLGDTQFLAGRYVPDRRLNQFPYRGSRDDIDILLLVGRF